MVSLLNSSFNFSKVDYSFHGSKISKNLPHMIDSKLLLDTVFTQLKRRHLNSRIVHQQMQEKTFCSNVCDLLTLVQVVEIQLQKNSNLGLGA